MKMRKRATAWKGMPKRFRAGEDVVSISVVPGYAAKEKDKKYRTLGTWDDDDGITLSAMMTREQARLTLWHETLHEALEQAGVKSETAEAFLDAIDDQSFRIVCRNPKLRRFLFEEGP